MILTLLGTGTSTGVPLIGCDCKVCRSRNPKNHRLRAAAWLQTEDKSILIDTSTDLRTQALRAKIKGVDGVLYTHPHADHLHGIDELRSYNYLQRETIPVFGNEWTTGELTSRFPYIFHSGPIEGGGKPQISLKTIDAAQESLDILGVRVIPISLPHGKRECVGYRFGDVAYVTDCSYIPNHSLERLRDLEVLVLDCVRIQPHPTHLNLERALEVVENVRPRKTYLTHLGHDFDYASWTRKLPKGVALAYDGLKIRGDSK
jgi:phosphoribosyl 1,2-cyclic phosphate phosphodiesterase